MILDIKTLVVISIVISFISAISLFFVARILQQVQGLKYAALGAGFQALAASLLVIRGGGEASLVIILLTNASYFFSWVFFYQSARLLSDKKATWMVPLGLILVFLPLVYIFRSHADVSERVLTTSIAFGLFFIMTGYVILTNPEKLAGRTILASTFFSGGLLCVVTVIKVLTRTEAINTIPDLRVLQLVFLWFIANTFLITSTFIILSSAKLQHLLKKRVLLLGHARDLADQSLKQQQHFLSMLSHEFKAPLGAIEANVDVVNILKKEKTPIEDVSLSRIKNVSERLSKLVDHCLSNEWLAHSIEEHNSALEPLSLRDVLQRVGEEYSVNVSGIASPAMIKGEPIFLPILFSNLVDNACHYASDINAVEFEIVEGTSHYIVNIRDDGPGIAQAQQAHIFERYYQANTENSDSGSGLGLYFVKRITEMHGGTVSVDCQAKTTFTVTLPKLELEHA